MMSDRLESIAECEDITIICSECGKSFPESMVELKQLFPPVKLPKDNGVCYFTYRPYSDGKVHYDDTVLSCPFCHAIHWYGFEGMDWNKVKVK